MDSIKIQIKKEEQLAQPQPTPQAKPQLQSPSSRQAVPDSVTVIFEHWQRVMDHPKAVLDKQRRRVIQQALTKGYSVGDVCKAISGCAQTPHNRGQNDRGERYDGLHLILRSADQIDRKRSGNSIF